MKLYQVIIKEPAQKQIKKVSTVHLSKIKTAILDLQHNPRPINSMKLVGSKSVYRIRVGVYRIVYEIIDKELFVYIVDVDHRKDIYK
jgi:mRNA interferase RelE/StbE